MSIVTERMESIPAGENPFHHDYLNMGVYLGKNIVAMLQNHTTEKCNWVYLVNTDTGERIRITFNGNMEIPLNAEKPCHFCGKAIEGPMSGLFLDRAETIPAHVDCYKVNAGIDQ